MDLTNIMECKVENLQCFRCFITFSDPKSKARHMKKTHGDIYKQQLQQTETKFSCYKCDKFYYTSEELSEHSATHGQDGKSFQCPYCRSTFYTFSELTKHRRLDCGKRQCLCKDCGIRFPNPSRLSQHRLKVHSSRAGSPKEEDLTYKCCKCNCIFHNEDELIDHHERDLDCTVSEPRSPPKKRGRKPKSGITVLATNDETLFTKDQGESRSAKDALDIEEGKSKLQIPCPEANCDLVFSSVDALRAHKKEAHARPSRKPHTCTESGQGFSEADQLTIYIEKEHCSEEYTCLTCLTCGEGFSETSHLLGHMRSHCKKEEPEFSEGNV